MKPSKWWNKRILDDLLEEVAGHADIHIFSKLQRLGIQNTHYPMLESFGDGIEIVETNVGSSVVKFHKKSNRW